MAPFKPSWLQRVLNADGGFDAYAVDGDGKVTSCASCTGTWTGDEDMLVTPGLVDIQVNGFAGLDFNADGVTPQALDVVFASLLRCGVTRFLPTFITASQDRLISLIRAFDDAVDQTRLGPSMVAGYHVEGPFLSPIDGYSGAHPAEHMMPASRAFVDRLRTEIRRPVRIMTVAPEIDGALDLISYLFELGVTCAIGHSAASRADVDAAVRAGATLSTHLGNGLPHELNKNDNPLFAQLGRDDLFADFIADGIHIPRDNLQTYLRAKTPERAILITDATAAAGPGIEPGIYTLGTEKVQLDEDGTVRQPGSRYLAGSSASMDQLVRNVMGWYGYSFPDALRMMRVNPLRVLGEMNTSPVVGERAEFVAWKREEGAYRVIGTVLGSWSATYDVEDR